MKVEVILERDLNERLKAANAKHLFRVRVERQVSGRR
jgi:hypothetical protein